MRITNIPCDVEVVGVLGTDLTVVNAARISFNTRKDQLDQADEKLIAYLARNKHYSPFRHCQIQFRIKAPEFVMRQAYKHVVGAEWTSTHPTKDHAWNEMSGRYKVYEEVYVPPVWYGQHKSAKQCSGAALPEQKVLSDQFVGAVEQITATYTSLVQQGVAKEQARMLLPLNIMTETVWTASLQAIHNFVELPKSPHAQREIRILASTIEQLTTQRFPIAFAALTATSVT